MSIDEYVLGEHDFNFDNCDLNETYVHDAGGDILAPINKVNKDIGPFSDQLKVGHLNTRSIPKHHDELKRLL